MVTITRDHSILAMSPNNEAAARAASGAEVVFQTLDCFSNTITKEDEYFSSVGWDQINPATGPLYIEGAEAGDILKVEILDIRIEDQGVMAVGPGMGVLGEIIKKEATRIIPIKDGKAIFNEKLHLPIKPMIGVIGTAPPNEDIPTGTPGAHGGNMDCKKIAKGATLYLPVNVSGALLAMGDLHAIMGDGEIVICGLEIPGEVKVRVSVIKGETYPLPLLDDGEMVMTIVSAKTVDEAAKQATISMHSILVEKLGMTIEEAGMFLSIGGDLKICQVVDPLMTARMELSKSVFAQYGYNFK
ncbi:acetamidase/formamidase family protein [Peribacillus glennii]|uniref:Acetamidase n=1 Tax=Peribacillus glennii TaxID=2303991 RepID=A0A372L7C1_9BACI|nr:acetamidase/formamidase family protein [Peribacillus glennii]RFU61110.1 acetamidase [Peribacillus glennii]